MPQVNVLQLSPEDQVLGYGELGNFSVAGFEMVLNRLDLASFVQNFCNSSRLIKRCKNVQITLAMSQRTHYQTVAMNVTSPQNRRLIPALPPTLNTTC